MEPRRLAQAGPVRRRRRAGGERVGIQRPQPRRAWPRAPCETRSADGARRRRWPAWSAATASPSTDRAVEELPELAVAQACQRPRGPEAGGAQRAHLVEEAGGHHGVDPRRRSPGRSTGSGGSSSTVTATAAAAPAPGGAGRVMRHAGLLVHLQRPADAHQVVGQDAGRRLRIDGRQAGVQRRHAQRPRFLLVAGAAAPDPRAAPRTDHAPAPGSTARCRRRSPAAGRAR